MICPHLGSQSTSLQGVYTLATALPTQEAQDQEPEESLPGERDPTPSSHLSVVISAYNEEESLPILFDEVLDELRGWTSLELIIVNDGSTDRTEEVMHELKLALVERERPEVSLVLCSLAENQGMGAALKTGYRTASQPWVSFLPGDGQIAPSMLLLLCEAAQRGARVVTTRYTNRDYTPYRKVLSRGLRLLSRVIIGVKITSEGMYLIERDTLLAMPMTSDSFMLNLEIPIRAARAQLPMAVVGIEVRPRQGGVSSATQLSRIFGTLSDLVALRWRMLRERS